MPPPSPLAKGQLTAGSGTRRAPHVAVSCRPGMFEATAKSSEPAQSFFCLVMVGSHPQPDCTGGVPLSQGCLFPWGLRICALICPLIYVPV